jgi:hypothetical protein
MFVQTFGKHRGGAVGKRGNVSRPDRTLPELIMEDSDSIDEEERYFACETCANICFSIDRTKSEYRRKIIRLTCANCGWSAQWDLDYFRANKDSFNVADL